jgi:hypothetical protein
MTSPLKLRPNPSIIKYQIGDEQQPLLTIDDCLADPAAVLSIAARATFSRHGPHYPGIRSPVPQQACIELIAPLANEIMRAFCLKRPPLFQECYLSLVTTAPQDLQPIQRLPHFDGVEPERLAFLLYLDRGETGGTAFYKQRQTGFETVDAARFAAFESALARDIALHGLPKNGYINGDTALYQQVGKISGLFNRAVIYRGNSLHCADLGADFVPDADPQTGRLTFNLFLRG